MSGFSTVFQLTYATVLRMSMNEKINFLLIQSMKNSGGNEGVASTFGRSSAVLIMRKASCTNQRKRIYIHEVASNEFKIIYGEHRNALME